MVEFAFDMKSLFPNSIIRVQPHQLRPSSPSCRLSQILDVMGQFSAQAQGLQQPVTSARKLAGDQVVYIISDREAGRLAVTGLLKVGTKDLFLHDENGTIKHCDRTPSILDFYVHETRQRRGQGKRLFDLMLDDQGWKAHQCSVDRPSSKLIGFLGKHYGLIRTIPQANNFVLYEGFFGDQEKKPCCRQVRGMAGSPPSRLASTTSLPVAYSDNRRTEQAERERRRKWEWERQQECERKQKREQELERERKREQERKGERERECEQERERDRERERERECERDGKRQRDHAYGRNVFNNSRNCSVAEVLGVGERISNHPTYASTLIKINSDINMRVADVRRQPFQRPKEAK